MKKNAGTFSAVQASNDASAVIGKDSEQVVLLLSIRSPSSTTTSTTVSLSHYRYLHLCFVFPPATHTVMDGDDHSNNAGLFHHLFDQGHLGEAIGHLVRGILPHHPPPAQTEQQSQDASVNNAPTDVPPLRPSVSSNPESIGLRDTAESGAGSGQGPNVREV